MNKPEEEAQAIANQFSFDSPVFRSMLINDIAAALKAREAATREECAKVADTYRDYIARRFEGTQMPVDFHAAVEIATSIRALESAQPRNRKEVSD